MAVFVQIGQKFLPTIDHLTQKFGNAWKRNILGQIDSNTKSNNADGCGHHMDMLLHASLFTKM